MLNYTDYDFGCPVISVNYNLLTMTGHVRLDEGNCVDMANTIEAFKNSIPDITHIITWSGDEVDTQYVLHDGEWIAI